MTKYIGPKTDGENVATQADKLSLSSETPDALTPDQTGAAGTATTAARSDHQHEILAASAGTITGTNAEGSSTSFARADHDHQIRAVGSFYARRTTATSGIGAGSGVNIVFPTEDYDVSGWYDTSNGRFTPQIAGYYFLGCFLYFDTISSGYWQVRLGKNGGASSELMLREPTDHTSYPRQGASVIVKANGTTDYFQINVFNGSSVTRSILDSSYFYGYFIGTD